eukprot:jgi/Mesvir1/25340/Mv14023-RA.1
MAELYVARWLGLVCTAILVGCLVHLERERPDVGGAGLLMSPMQVVYVAGFLHDLLRGALRHVWRISRLVCAMAGTRELRNVTFAAFIAAMVIVAEVAIVGHDGIVFALCRPGLEPVDGGSAVAKHGGFGAQRRCRVVAARQGIRALCGGVWHDVALSGGVTVQGHWIGRPCRFLVRVQGEVLALAFLASYGRVCPDRSARRGVPLGTRVLRCGKLICPHAEHVGVGCVLQLLPHACLHLLYPHVRREVVGGADDVGHGGDWEISLPGEDDMAEEDGYSDVGERLNVTGAWDEDYYAQWLFVNLSAWVAYVRGKIDELVNAAPESFSDDVYCTLLTLQAMVGPILPSTRSAAEALLAEVAGDSACRLAQAAAALDGDPVQCVARLQFMLGNLEARKSEFAWRDYCVAAEVAGYSPNDFVRAATALFGDPVQCIKRLWFLPGMMQSRESEFAGHDYRVAFTALDNHLGYWETIRIQMQRAGCVPMAATPAGTVPARARLAVNAPQTNATSPMAVDARRFPTATSFLEDALAFNESSGHRAVKVEYYLRILEGHRDVFYNEDYELAEVSGCILEKSNGVANRYIFIAVPDRPTTKSQRRDRVYKRGQQAYALVAATTHFANEYIDEVITDMELGLVPKQRIQFVVNKVLDPEQLLLLDPPTATYSAGKPPVKRGTESTTGTDRSASCSWERLRPGPQMAEAGPLCQVLLWRAANDFAGVTTFLPPGRRQLVRALLGAAGCPLPHQLRALLLWWVRHPMHATGSVVGGRLVGAGEGLSTPAVGGKENSTDACDWVGVGGGRSGEETSGGPYGPRLDAHCLHDIGCMHANDRPNSHLHAHITAVGAGACIQRVWQHRFAATCAPLIIMRPMCRQRVSHLTLMHLAAGDAAAGVHGDISGTPLPCPALAACSVALVRMG